MFCRTSIHRDSLRACGSWGGRPQRGPALLPQSDRHTPDGRVPRVWQCVPCPWRWPGPPCPGSTCQVSRLCPRPSSLFPLVHVDPPQFGSGVLDHPVDPQEPPGWADSGRDPWENEARPSLRSEPCPGVRGRGNQAGRRSVRPDVGIRTWPLLKGGCCPRGPRGVLGPLSSGTSEPRLAHGGSANLISLASSPS